MINLKNMKAFTEAVDNINVENFLKEDKETTVELEEISSAAEELEEIIAAPAPIPAPAQAPAPIIPEVNQLQIDYIEVPDDGDDDEIILKDLREEVASDMTRAEMVQRLVDTVFSNYSLTNINVGYFGDFVQNMIPRGYYVQTVGKHSFFIKDKLAQSLSSVIPLMDKIRSELKHKKIMHIPLVYPRNLEGSTMRALIITTREIQEILKSYPDLKFGFTDHYDKIDSINLVVQSGR